MVEKALKHKYESTPFFLSLYNFLHMLLQKSFNNLLHTAVIIVIYRDKISGFFYAFFCICHCNADAGRFNHWDIVFFVAGRNRIFYRDIAVRAQKTKRRAFCRVGISVFQQTGVRKDAA